MATRTNVIRHARFIRPQDSVRKNECAFISLVAFHRSRTLRGPRVVVTCDFGCFPRRKNPYSMRMDSSHYLIRPGVHFLNHGSYGACPARVLERFHAWHRDMEAQPVEFLNRRFRGLMHEARANLGAYLNADPARLVFVPNATHALNIAAASIPLRTGDVVLTSSHEYGATDRMWEKICAARGARYQRVEIPLPAPGAEDIAARLLEHLTPAVKVLFMSHLTSPTALRLPVERVVPAARAAGVVTMIDGAHAPGQIPLDLDALGADLYVGNCHKWLSAPFGSGFLYVAPQHQDEIRTPQLSWGRLPPGPLQRWDDEFLWTGTRDPSAYFALPAAIDFLAQVGWDRFRRHTHALARDARRRLVELTGQSPLAPDSPDWYGSMAQVPLPDGEAAPLQQRLWEEYRIEAPIVAWNDRRWIRVSCHLYNTREQITYLIDALRHCLK